MVFSIVDGSALAAGLNLTCVSGVVRSENNSLTSSMMNGGTCAVRCDEPCEPLPPDAEWLISPPPPVAGRLLPGAAAGRRPSPSAAGQPSPRPVAGRLLPGAAAGRRPSPSAAAGRPWRPGVAGRPSPRAATGRLSLPG